MVVQAAGVTAFWLRLHQLQARFAAVLAKRTRIARELHDTLAQGFVGVHSQLQAVDMALPRTTPLRRCGVTSGWLSA